MALTSKQAMPRAGSPQDGARIDLHVGEIRQLFNSMDPSPFRERDLDPKAEAYIVESARELGSKKPLRLTISVADVARVPPRIWPPSRRP